MKLNVPTMPNQKFLWTHATLRESGPGAAAGICYVGVILGLYRDNGKENGNYKDYITGIMEKKMETVRIIFQG